MNNPRIRSRALLALALSATLVSGVAIAQQSPSNAPVDGTRANGGMRDRIMQLDTDRDGRISSKEAAANPQMAQRFAQLDSNRDGYLDRVDFQARNQQKREDCFANADTDKDGKLSRTEYDASRQQCGSQRGMRGGQHQGSATPPPAG